MDTSLTVRNMRRQAWALMLREQSASGLSVREWCRQNHLSVKAFYYRRRQVQTMVLETAEKPESMVLETAEKPEFAELVMPEPVSGMTSRIVSNPVYSFVPLLTITAGDMTISVTRDTPRQLIADVLEVIRNA